MNFYKFRYTKINVAFFTVWGTLLVLPSVHAICTSTTGSKLTTDDTLYYCSDTKSYDEIEINTTQAAGLTPLTGYVWHLQPLRSVEKGFIFKRQVLKLMEFGKAEVII